MLPRWVSFRIKFYTHSEKKKYKCRTSCTNIFQTFFWIPHSQLQCVELTSRSDAFPNGRKLLLNASFSLIGSNFDHFLVLSCHTIQWRPFFFSVKTLVCVKRRDKQSWQLGKGWFLFRLLVAIGVLFIKSADCSYRI